MHVDVIRDRNRLIIQWTNEDSDRWAVTKLFNLDTREMQDATISGTFRTKYTARDARKAAYELSYSARLAEQMNSVFVSPSDFDRVEMDNGPSLGCDPAYILTPFRPDDKIYIATAPKDANF